MKFTDLGEDILRYVVSFCEERTASTLSWTSRALRDIFHAGVWKECTWKYTARNLGKRYGVKVLPRHVLCRIESLRIEIGKVDVCKYLPHSGYDLLWDTLVQCKNVSSLTVVGIDKRMSISLAISRRQGVMDRISPCVSNLKAFSVSRGRENTAKKDVNEVQLEAALVSMLLSGSKHTLEVCELDGKYLPYLSLQDFKKLSHVGLHAIEGFEGYSSIIAYHLPDSSSLENLDLEFAPCKTRKGAEAVPFGLGGSFKLPFTNLRKLSIYHPRFDDPLLRSFPETLEHLELMSNRENAGDFRQYSQRCMFGWLRRVRMPRLAVLKFLVAEQCDDQLSWEFGIGITTAFPGLEKLVLGVTHVAAPKYLESLASFVSGLVELTTLKCLFLCANRRVLPHRPPKSFVELLGAQKAIIVERLSWIEQVAFTDHESNSNEIHLVKGGVVMPSKQILTRGENSGQPNDWETALQ